MADYMVRATAADNSIRCFAITSKDTVEYARVHHNSTPVVTAALGRLLSAGAMMGAMMKGEKDKLTLQIQCNGPIQGLTVTADSMGGVKGFPVNPYVDLPLKEDGHLNVGGALDLGILSVIKDLGLKDPYVGQCQLQTGEIAEDLTYYFASSEQVPSAVGLGVLVNPDGSVKQAGGFIIQLMPFTPDEVIDKLEQTLMTMPSVTQLLERGLNPEEILETILGEFGVQYNDTLPIAFNCNCSKERISAALATLSRSDMDELIEDGKNIEVKCQFCNTPYQFTTEDLIAIREYGRR